MEREDHQELAKVNELFTDDLGVEETKDDIEKRLVVCDEVKRGQSRTD